MEFVCFWTVIVINHGVLVSRLPVKLPEVLAATVVNFMETGGTEHMTDHILYKFKSERYSLLTGIRLGVRLHELSLLF